MRKEHPLSRIKTSRMPKNLIFFDTESHIEEFEDKILHKPYLWFGWHVYRDKKKKSGMIEQERFFTTANDFWKWVESKAWNGNVLYMFAHNPSYDLIAGQIYECLQSKGYKIDMYYEKGRTFILKLKNKKRKIVILNTGNWFEGSVADIGKMLGLEKQEIDYEHASFEEALPYCRRDVEIIKKAMMEWIKFCSKNKLGVFSLTAPSQAFSAFRTRFMKSQVYIHSNKNACELERKSYYGGRTECARIGKIKEKEVFVLDINSMYPSVMKENFYPTAIHGYRENIPVYKMKEYMKKFLICAEVKVKTEIPCVPVRLNQRILFPVGEFITDLCTPELELIMKYGKILEVKKVALYWKADLFSDYVNFFYTARQKAKSEGNKMLMGKSWRNRK